eukprot:871-Heterococcus_DN1.PRE.1
MSIAQRPCTSDLAAVTHLFPGPTMMSQAGTEPEPKASAATPCAPPMHSSRSAPATCAAAMVIGSGLGEATTTVLTPAARAVTAVMSTEEGSG